MAEGGETIEQRELLAALGCSPCQGYLCARPLPLAEFERLPAVPHPARQDMARAALLSEQ